MKFKLKNYKQLSNVELDGDRDLMIVGGINGSGKTTLLNMYVDMLNLSFINDGYLLAKYVIEKLSQCLIHDDMHLLDLITELLKYCKNVFRIDDALTVYTTHQIMYNNYLDEHDTSDSCGSKPHLKPLSKEDLEQLFNTVVYQEQKAFCNQYLDNDELCFEAELSLTLNNESMIYMII